MFGKLLAVVVGFVVLFGAALRLSGAPLIPRGEEEASDDVEAIDPEADRTEWIEHVDAICDWERKRLRALIRIYRRGNILGAPKDLEIMLLAAIRMGDESKAIFNRLTPPFEYRREVRELRRLFRQERRALEGLVKAVQNLDHRRFVRGWRDLATANGRKVKALRDLGLKKCVPRSLPREAGEPDRKIV
jgi:hypothetical protein